jgi:hypothetical protein
MSTPARNIVRLLCVCGLTLLVAAALNFVVDPLQLLRPARFYPAMYSADSRMQNAGLIGSQDFDTVFMGNSLAVHFRQSDIDRLLSVRSVKLAMSGADSREQSLVLAAALERHPHRLIWQVDDWIFRNPAEAGPDQMRGASQATCSAAPWRVNRYGCWRVRFRRFGRWLHG